MSFSGMNAGQRIWITTQHHKKRPVVKPSLTETQRTASRNPLCPLTWRKGQLRHGLRHQVKLKLKKGWLSNLQGSTESWIYGNYYIFISPFTCICNELCSCSWVKQREMVRNYKVLKSTIALSHLRFHFLWF